MHLKSKFIIFPLVFFSLLTACTTLSNGEGSAHRDPLLGLSVLQGFTDSNSTEITVLGPKGKPLKYFVRAETQEGEFALRDISIEHFDREDSAWAVDRLRICGLTAQRTFRLEIRDLLDQLIDTREFYALQLDGTGLRFAVAGGLDDKFQDKYLKGQAQIWQELLHREPQMLFLIGENVMATEPAPLVGVIGPSRIWERYVESRLALELFRAPTLVPTLAIWDDKDYGSENGDRDFNYRKDSAEIFRIFYAQEPDHGQFTNGPGTAHFLEAFHMGFALMDNRYFRAPSPRNGNDGHSLWGAAQERWLIDKITEYDRPVWILNADAIFSGGGSAHSFENSYPLSYKKYIPELADQPNPLIFLTGHERSTQILQIDGPQMKTFEVTTSGIHSKLRKVPKSSPPRQLEGRFDKANYLIIESAPISGVLTAKITAYSLNNEILYHRYISVAKSKKLVSH